MAAAARRLHAGRSAACVGAASAPPTRDFGHDRWLAEAQAHSARLLPAKLHADLPRNHPGRVGDTAPEKLQKCLQSDLICDFPLSRGSTNVEKPHTDLRRNHPEPAPRRSPRRAARRLGPHRSLAHHRLHLPRGWRRATPRVSAGRRAADGRRKARGKQGQEARQGVPGCGPLIVGPGRAIVTAARRWRMKSCELHGALRGLQEMLLVIRTFTCSLRRQTPLRRASRLFPHCSPSPNHPSSPPARTHRPDLSPPPPACPIAYRDVGRVGGAARRTPQRHIAHTRRPRPCKGPTREPARSPEAVDNSPEAVDNPAIFNPTASASIASSVRT